MWLVDVEDAFEQTYAWIGEAGVTRPILLDLEGTNYESYSESGAASDGPPYPLHVVVDGDGIIRYLSRENHPDEVREAIQAALESL